MHLLTPAFWARLDKTKRRGLLGREASFHGEGTGDCHAWDGANSRRSNQHIIAKTSFDVGA